ncbi:MAG: ATP-binding cassette domain-containing protein [Planctomycetota bacterium]|jgi:ABC-2 type transport system ATP-binding protein
MIEAQNVTKMFPGTVALEDISFSVEKGEVVGFVGPNAAGKTTMMRILTSYLPPTRGAARVAGFDVVARSMDVRRRVGYLPETNPLYADMRVREYLRFRAGIKGVARAGRAKRVDEATERCGLVAHRKKIIGTLSKGFRQRVGLADAIIHQPEIIILDEPTQGLDPIQVREVRGLIRELGEKRTVMLSTHILTEVEKVCSRVIIIHRGRIIASGAPMEIAARITRTNRVRVEAQGDGPEMKKTLEEISGVARVFWTTKDAVHTFIVEPSEKGDLRPEIFRLATEQKWLLMELAFERVSLEAAFTELTAVADKIAERGAADA